MFFLYRLSQTTSPFLQAFEFILFFEVSKLWIAPFNYFYLYREPNLYIRYKTSRIIKSYSTDVKVSYSLKFVSLRQLFWLMDLFWYRHSEMFEPQMSNDRQHFRFYSYYRRHRWFKMTEQLKKMCGNLDGWHKISVIRSHVIGTPEYEDLQRCNQKLGFSFTFSPKSSLNIKLL